MILQFVYFGSILAVLLSLLGFARKIPFCNILAAIMFVSMAGLIGSFGIDVPTDQTQTIQEHSVDIDANTTDSNTTTSIETVYTNYGFSDPFVFAVFWVYMALGVALALMTFVY